MPKPTEKTLSGRAIRHLRALGHELDPVMAIGKAGITDGLVEETKRALVQHELIKVKIMREAPVDRKEAGEALAGATDSVVAQVLGRTVLLYKRHPKKPKIVLPKEKKETSKAAGAPAPIAEAHERDLDGDLDGDDADDGDVAVDGDDDGDVSDE